MEMINTYRTPKSGKFVQIDRTILDNRKLSLEAKAVLIYCLSKPDRWHHNEADIIKSCLNGRDSVRRAIADLVSAGYIIKHTERDELGQFCWSTWYILESPVLIDQLPGYSKTKPDFSQECQGSRPGTPPPDIPPTENPATVNPKAEIRPTENRKTESRPLSNNINTDTEPVKTNHQKAEQFPIWFKTFRTYFVQYGVMIPDDVDFIDWIDFKKRADVFLDKFSEIKNPKKYLETLVLSVRRKSQDEIDEEILSRQKKLETQQKIQDKETKASIESERLRSFNFSSLEQISEQLVIYDKQSSQFKKYVSTPQDLPGYLLLVLKGLYLMDHKSQ